MSVPAHNHLAPARNSTSNKLIIIRVFADGSPQDLIRKDFCIRGNKINDRLKIYPRKLLSQCFAYSLIPFKDFLGNDQLQFSVPPSLKDPIGRPGEKDTG